MAEIKITQTRSAIGRKEDQIRTVKALGLKRVGHSVVKTRNDAIDGMIDKVAHLISVTDEKA